MMAKKRDGRGDDGVTVDGLESLAAAVAAHPESATTSTVADLAVPPTSTGSHGKAGSKSKRKRKANDGLQVGEEADEIDDSTVEAAQVAAALGQVRLSFVAASEETTADLELLAARRQCHRPGSARRCRRPDRGAVRAAVQEAEEKGRDRD